MQKRQSKVSTRRFRCGAVTVRIVFLDRVQNLHIHAVRANFHIMFSVGIYSDGFPIPSKMSTHDIFKHARLIFTYILGARMSDYLYTDRHVETQCSAGTRLTY